MVAAANFLPSLLLVLVVIRAGSSLWGAEASVGVSTENDGSGADSDPPETTDSSCVPDKNTTKPKSNPSPIPIPPYATSFPQRYLFLEKILASAYHSMDPALPAIVSELIDRGAHRCWHKHSTFLDHLLGVHHVLRLWGRSETEGRLATMHSAYSNSYVDLALFDRNDPVDRDRMRSIVGEEAEALVYLYCVVDRQAIVVDTLLARGYVPAEGLDVPHLRDEGATVHLSSSDLRTLLVFTMADIADQYFGWQDRLFGGAEQTDSMLLPGGDDRSHHESTALWPGVSAPGLWMSYASALCAVAGTDGPDGTYDGDLPPVFRGCTAVLDRGDEARARDLYWSVATDASGDPPAGWGRAVEVLEEAVGYNPWAFEPYVMLAQKYLHVGRNGEAREAAERALELQMEWGTAWDKRLGFGAWVAWTRVLYRRAVDGLGWPEDSWEVNNFGMVR